LLGHLERFLFGTAQADQRPRQVFDCDHRAIKIRR
jgi:hypothetical protein